MRFFRCRPVFFSFLRLLFCSWYHRLPWHACVSKQKITSLPQNIGFIIWPIISASLKKVLWKSQGEEVKIYASSRSYIIYILLFDFYSLTVFSIFPVSYYRNFQSKVCRIFILHYFSANILKRMFERWVNHWAYLNDYQMSSKNAQSVLNTKF